MLFSKREKHYRQLKGVLLSGVSSDGLRTEYDIRRYRATTKEIIFVHAADRHALVTGLFVDPSMFIGNHLLTAHSSTFPSLHRRHSSSYNTPLLHLRHRQFTYVTWRAAHFVFKKQIYCMYLQFLKKTRRPIKVL